MISDVKRRRCPQGDFYNSNKTIQELEAEYLATFKKTVAQHEVSDLFEKIYFQYEPFPGFPAKTSQSPQPQE